MPVYHVERSITIDAPLETIKDVLRDFKQSPKWSPWLVMEPDATLTFSDRQGQVGATYAWAGTLVGVGSAELTEVQDTQLKMDLQFVKPFKSPANVTYILSEDEKGTKVIWQMDGYLPFYMFWFIRRIKSYIGMDFTRGLQMLKEYMETGSVASYTIIEGVEIIPAQTYVGIRNSASFDELGEVMHKDFMRLKNYLNKQNIAIEGTPFTIYETFNILSNHSYFVSCIPVLEDVTLQSGIIEGELLPVKALKTRFVGDYKHLRNAWATAMQFVRMKKLKIYKQPVGYEFYINDPSKTEKKNLVTEIYIPLR